MHEGVFHVSDLMLIRAGTPPDLQPRQIGQNVRLNSGGPVMLVVDVDGMTITVAYLDGELTIPAACLQCI